jgi:protein gp37
MGDVSIIEWTDSTWNPWRGCDKVSPGCAHCYMFRDQRRYGRDPSKVVRAADTTFYAPLRSGKWKRQREEAIAARGFHFVFTCSWSDWFHEDADEWRDEAWQVIRDTPDSIYQVLTKRPERMGVCLPPDWGEGYPNVWLGVTIENRRFVDRADLLRAVPAAMRFISAEPLLGPLIYDEMPIPLMGGPEDNDLIPEWSDGADHPELDLTDIDWIITGGESGSGHRRFDPAWAIDIRDAAAKTGTAFLHKQNGGPRPTSKGRLLDGRTYDEFPVALTA